MNLFDKSTQTRQEELSAPQQKPRMYLRESGSIRVKSY